MVIRIRLPRGEWQYDPEQCLGRPGGFGTVCAGRGEDGSVVAVKRLKLSAARAGHRELSMADELIGRKLQHVVPILDAGLDADTQSYFVVMAKAERSLQEELDRVKRFSELDSARILLQIATGLSEVPNIVHRDLKPANVLYCEGRWAIADFGIARFLEESTSSETLKAWRSPQYAAPEQWRLERATDATDVYALGCIAYSLLTGTPPFPGPGDLYKEQHLYEAPPDLDGIQPKLRSLIVMMLSKPREARPSLDRVLGVLREAVGSEQQRATGGGLASLAEVGAIAAERAARTEADRLQRQARQLTRASLADHAKRVLIDLLDTLKERVLDAAPVARTFQDRNHLLRIQLLNARLLAQLLEVGKGGMIPEGAFVESKWEVLLGAAIAVVQDAPLEYRWAANLWYTNRGSGDQYRWWEIPYMYTGKSRPRSEYEPFALDDLKDADLAASQVGHVVRFASDPRPVDGEDIDDFCDRWAELFAKAVKGELEKPRYMPFEW